MHTDHVSCYDQVGRLPGKAFASPADVYQDLLAQLVMVALSRSSLKEDIAYAGKRRGKKRGGRSRDEGAPDDEAEEPAEPERTKRRR